MEYWSTSEMIIRKHKIFNRNVHLHQITHIHTHPHIHSGTFWNDPLTSHVWCLKDAWLIAVLLVDRWLPIYYLLHQGQPVLRYFSRFLIIAGSDIPLRDTTLQPSTNSDIYWKWCIASQKCYNWNRRQE